jgi:ribonucleoside-diphosphate reductase alpha chain
MTVREVADYLSVSPGTVRSWVSQCYIPHARRGRAVRFHRARIDEWLARGGRHAPKVAVFRRPRARREEVPLRDQLLRERYLRKNSEGRIVESPRQMFARVAGAVAAAEAAYGATRERIRSIARQFCRAMLRGEFLPNSPTLMNAGRENGMLSACFVLPVPDSIDGIFDAVKNTALIQKAGGGTGFAIDSLRPTGDRVASSCGTTSGPISFWRVFAETTTAIQQGALRRGANMGMMSITHPDILKFICAKQDGKAFTNFNISVKVPDAFMASLEDQPNDPHVVANPRTGDCYLIPRDVDPATYTIKDLVPISKVNTPCFTVRQMWDRIIRNAHATGEPGICFIDRVNRANPTVSLGRIEATNPCGEQPLLPYESCNLGSINLERFVREDDKDMNWDGLKETVALAVRFLDDVIDVNYYPIPEVREQTLANRKIGLGVMGFADALVLLGVRYDSEQAVELAGRLAKFIQENAHKASAELAQVRGTFPNFESSHWNTPERRSMRNATCTTIAPTGSLSLIAGCTGGIEPIFSATVMRRILGKEHVQVHPLIERFAEHLDEDARLSLIDGVPPAKIPGFTTKMARVFVTAHEVAPEWHVRIQAAFQKYVDNAVSKTVNLPANARVEDVDQVYRLAYRLGCKGVTVYRDGSREGQTLTAAKGRGKARRLYVVPRPRSRETVGKTVKFRMGCGTLFVTVNQDSDGLCEVFANLGKAGGCPSQSEATCRAVSAALRSGVDPKVLVEQLSGCV